jgi:hypothetical protein
MMKDLIHTEAWAKAALSCALFWIHHSALYSAWQIGMKV